MSVLETEDRYKPLYLWNSLEVKKWCLEQNGVCFQLYADLLEEHDVSGRTLMRMNEIKLERIGISNVGHRRDLLRGILVLRLKHETTELKHF